MSDQQPNDLQTEAESWIGPGQKNAQLIYILYLVGLMLPVTTIVGIVLAYMNRGNSEEWIDSHYTYAIRTFWIGILYAFISFLTAFILIGFLLGIAAAVWFIVRCVIGLQAITRSEPVKNVETWLV
ncbi:DUF4870 domain-containing protein [Hoeflea prorocentri]|uniref:DUF4870 domain-containing protein n=1 Tax=Hoeflea prorocentri TaxID=1922333 RepID=A0A9X3UJ19_9HYPH|nr:DUF4870 domain-containing protein [Hoeflea prorocentri]MCY6382278.1 hypothetical protein [Hoeflea prorocentri]MDA5400078.1 hypothetical protein [Hoeflea prorocentri]